MKGLSCVRDTIRLWKKGQSIFPGAWTFFGVFEESTLKSRIIGVGSDDRSFILETLVLQFLGIFTMKKSRISDHLLCCAGQ